MSAAHLVLNPLERVGAGGPGPRQPSLIGPGFDKPLVFTDVDALARHIHRQRGRRGLRLSRTVASYAGSDTFPCFTVRWLDEHDGGETYAFTVAIQSDRQSLLEAALANTTPTH